MSGSVVIKGVVAQSTFDYVKQVHGDAVWNQCLDRLSEGDRVAVTAGGNVPLESMGRFNEALVAVVCQGSRSCAQDEFRRMGAASAEKLLTGGGIFSLFARFVSPKQVFARAESVVKSAYPGAIVTATLNDDESGGMIRLEGMSGYPYGSQRIVGWLLRGIEIVGGRNARVSERSWDSGLIDSDVYEIAATWNA